ncbi:MAG: AAA family ATPase [Bacteroidales bacterium]|nr:AAA family ATPase [Bacteroidales bacterium]
MIKTHVIKEIVEKLGFAPTVGQLEAINALSEFTVQPNGNECMLLMGYAGTGKTSLIAAYVKALDRFGISYQLLAPTGRAAKVLAEYSGCNAYTIHKVIYRQQSSTDGFGRFTLNFNKSKNTIYIVDEASMISNQAFDDSAFGSGKLLSDLIEYVRMGKDCKLMLVGDTAQLPPVGLDISPALNPTELEALGLNVRFAQLNEVIRQQFDSGILHNATAIRELIDSSTNDFPRFNLDYRDVQRISGGELLEYLSDEYSKNGREGNIVICYSNKRANRYNQGIRSKILYHEEELSVGDYLMVARNNYFWVNDRPNIGFIANGEIVRVKRIGKRNEIYGFRFADVTLELPDYNYEEFDAKLILDSLFMDGPSLGNESMKLLYQQVMADYLHLKTKKARMKQLQNDPFFNALQAKFAYAVTCHKAQGGQWPTVFIDQGFFNDDMLTREYLRWLYTAFTRATQKVYLVNFDEKFF